MALTRGVNHVGLTVSDIELTRSFFCDRLGFHEVGRKPSYPAVFVSDGHTMITLWQADPGVAVFDRRIQLGLHHLALTVASHQKLEALYALLKEDLEFEFAPESTGQHGARHMICQIPGGIRVEFMAPAEDLEP